MTRASTHRADAHRNPGGPWHRAHLGRAERTGTHPVSAATTTTKRPADAAPVEPPAAEADLEAAGLRWSTDAEPGITRRRHGKGFSYRRPNGEPVRDPRTIARIKALVIPPAWTDVWICPTASGHLQASGRDARGRKQYRYHDEWRRVRDESKFDRLATFGAALPDLRAAIDTDLSRPGLPRDKVVALVVCLLDRTLIRVGNACYREANGSFGLTTLYRRHVSLDGATVRFRFKGKSGVPADVRLQDRRISALVRRCHELGGRDLFSYVDESGAPQSICSDDCNDYLRAHVDETTTVKTFRTWGASALALELLAEDPPEGPPDKVLVAVVKDVAHHLGNTPAVARSSYIHPSVLEPPPSPAVEDAWARARTTDRMRRAERALVRLLDAG